VPSSRPVTPPRPSLAPVPSHRPAAPSPRAAAPSINPDVQRPVRPIVPLYQPLPPHIHQDYPQVGVDMAVPSTSSSSPVSVSSSSSSSSSSSGLPPQARHRIPNDFDFQQEARYFEEFGEIMPGAQYTHFVDPDGKANVAEAKKLSDEKAIDPNWDVDDEEESDEEEEPLRRRRGRKSKGKQKVQPKGKAKPRQKRKPLQGNTS